MAFVVREGYLDKGNVAGECSAAVHCRGLFKVNGNVVCVACIHACTYVCAYKEALVCEDSFVFGGAVGGGAFGVNVMEVEVFYQSLVCSLGEGFDKDMGYVCYSTDVHMLVRLNVAHCFRCAYV